MNVEVNNKIDKNLNITNTTQVKPSKINESDVNFAQELKQMANETTPNEEVVKTDALLETEFQEKETFINNSFKQNILIKEDSNIILENPTKENLSSFSLEKKFETENLEYKKEDSNIILENPTKENLSSFPLEKKFETENLEYKKEDTNMEFLTDNNSNEIKNIIVGLKNVVNEINQNQAEDKEFKKVNIINRTDENRVEKVKETESFSEENIENISKKKEDDILINNDINIQESQEKLMPQMNANMNFNTEGQPFSDFVKPQTSQELSNNEEDLLEEAAVLSTMTENIAIANRNQIFVEKNISKTTQIEKNYSELKQDISNNETIDLQPKTIINEQGIKKVDKNTDVVIETVVKYDTVVVTKNDAEFFTHLVEQGEIDVDTYIKETVKATQVSKTLADMLAKAIKDNQPVRIDFDNDISVIIKISKEGKISADFLPSSQIAEAYLKENLPILRQKFDENNIDYEELNQRKQKQNEKEDNRKKGRKDE